jgi:predicted dehydrogenase
MADAPFKPVGVGIIGVGGMGSYHGNKITEQLQDRAKLIGTFDIREVRQIRLAEKGWNPYPTREALLSDPRIDLVVIATPNEVHKEIALDAIAHGKHVLSEKPVTLSSEDLEEMIAAANKAGKIFTVHQNRRWDPDYLVAKKIIEENTLGHVFQIESRTHGSRGCPEGWRSEAAHGGGMVLDWGVHLIDQMLMLMEHKKLLTVYCQLTHVTTTEVDDGFRGIFTFEDDHSFLVEVLTNNFISLPRWYLLGVNGSARIKGWNHKDGEIIMVSDWENRDSVPIQAGVGITKTMAPRTDDTIEHFPLPEVHGDWVEYYYNLTDAIRGNAEPIVTHNQQRRLLKTLEAMFESGNTNTLIQFEDII